MGYHGNIGAFAQGLSQGLNPFIEMSIRQKLQAQQAQMQAEALAQSQTRQGVIRGQLQPTGLTENPLVLNNQSPMITGSSLPSQIQQRTPFSLPSPIGEKFYEPTPPVIDPIADLRRQKLEAEIRKLNTPAMAVSDPINELRKEKLQLDIAGAKSKQAEQAKASTNAGELIKSQAQDTLNTIDEVLKGKDYFGIRSTIPAIPGTPKYTWRTYIDKLTSGKMIDLMTKMKEASKTGATGFGQLSEREGQILLNAATALKPGISQAEAEKILNTMKVPLQKVLSGQGGGQQDLGGISEEDIQFTMQKYNVSREEVLKRIGAR